MALEVPQQKVMAQVSCWNCCSSSAAAMEKPASMDLLSYMVFSSSRAFTPFSPTFHLPSEPTMVPEYRLLTRARVPWSPPWAPQ